MTIKLTRKILNLTKNEEILKQGNRVIQAHTLMCRAKYRLRFYRNAYQRLSEIHAIRNIANLMHNTSERIRIEKIKCKNFERFFHRELCSFSEVARKNALEIACRPTPQAISRIMRGF